MLEQVRRTVERYRMVAPGDLVLVAVSGGPDSVALARALQLLAPLWQLRLHLFHLEHGLRGERGEADAAWVQAFARRLGLPCTVRAVRVGDLAPAYGGMEAAGRAVRYRELYRLAAEVGASRIAVGHNREDQAETVLLRLLRGTGRRGLGGMAPVRPAGAPAQAGSAVIRPLLETPRPAIVAFCRDEGLEPRQDETNAEMLYTRNRVRLELVPLLQQRYNPAVVEHLARLATVLTAEEEFLDAAARAALARHGVAPGPDGGVLPAAAFRDEPPAMVRRMVRLVAASAGVELGYEHVEAALAVAGRTASGQVDLPGGLRAAASYGALHLARAPAGDPHLAPPEVALPVPGALSRPDLNVVIRAEWYPPAGPPAAGPWQVDLDPASLPGPLCLRTWQPGDRISLMGMSGTKKLQDLFVDAKIPRRVRGRIPLVTAGDQVVWVVGVRPDRRFLARESDSRLSLRACPLDGDGTEAIPWKA